MLVHIENYIVYTEYTMYTKQPCTRMCKFFAMQVIIVMFPLCQEGDIDLKMLAKVLSPEAEVTEVYVLTYTQHMA